MTSFSKRCLCGAVIGFILTPIFFSTGSYLPLTKAMSPDTPFDEKAATSLSDAETRFAALSNETKSLYRSHLVRDIPFFLSMGLASASLILLAWGPGHKRWVYGFALSFTFAFMLFDAVENLAISTWFQADGPTDTSVTVASFATPLKFAAIVGTVPMLLMGVFLRVYNKKRQKVSGSSDKVVVAQ